MVSQKRPMSLAESSSESSHLGAEPPQKPLPDMIQNPSDLLFDSRMFNPASFGTATTLTGCTPRRSRRSCRRPGGQVFILESFAVLFVSLTKFTFGRLLRWLVRYAYNIWARFITSLLVGMSEKKCSGMIRTGPSFWTSSQDAVNSSTGDVTHIASWEITIT